MQMEHTVPVFAEAQAAPENPGGQVHTNEDGPSKHVPPFKQGALVQYDAEPVFGHEI